MYILLNLSSFIFLIEVLCAKIKHDHCACKRSLNRTSTASMVDVRLFLVYFYLEVHHHHHHLAAYLAPCPWSSSPALPLLSTEGCGPAQWRTTRAVEGRQGGPNDDDTKHPATTRNAQPRHGEPDDDAKSPRLRWARRRCEEPQVTVGPTTTRRPQQHGEPHDNAKSPRSWWAR